MTSGRKGKKICRTEDAVRAMDDNATKVLNHKTPLKQLPFGKTLVKQIFAGLCGLTVLAFMSSFLVGAPLDIEIDGWDANTRRGQRLVNHQMQVEDPYVTVITNPCGPWGAFSRWNISQGGAAKATVLECREQGRPTLRFVNKLVKDRIAMKRHVFLEHPWGSCELDEPEMADVRRLIDKGDLTVVRSDGCRLGYHDSESGLPHMKPMMFITDMKEAAATLETFRCICSGVGEEIHQQIIGSNCNGKRSEQAARWPEELDQIVLTLILKQIEIDETLGMEAFAVKKDKVKTGRGKGRGKSSKDQNTKNPVVGVKLQGHPKTKEFYAKGADPDVVPDDPELDRLQRSADLNPFISEKEKERRRNWMCVAKPIRAELRRQHVNLGHITNVGLLRRLRRSGARKEVLKAVQWLSCDACGDAIRTLHPRPTRLPGKFVFNYLIWCDVFIAYDIEGLGYDFLNIVCGGTRFQVVYAVGIHTGVVSSTTIMHYFTLIWTSWAGWPTVVRVDRGKEFMADFADGLTQHGVELDGIPLESPWLLGICEKLGGTWKEVWRRVVGDCQVSGLEDVQKTSTIISQVQNDNENVEGFSSAQWVLGQHRRRMPGSLLEDHERSMLEVQEAAADPGSAMAQSLQRRESAKISRIRLDNDHRVRTAALRKSTPSRGPFPVGSYVFFRRSQVKDGDCPDPIFRWFGMARVIGHEVSHPERADDPDECKDNEFNQSIWLRYKQGTVLASPTQLRFATEDELLMYTEIDDGSLEETSNRGARMYVDIRREITRSQREAADFSANPIVEPPQTSPTEENEQQQQPSHQTNLHFHYPNSENRSYKEQEARDSDAAIRAVRDKDGDTEMDDFNKKVDEILGPAEDEAFYKAETIPVPEDDDDIDTDLREATQKEDISDVQRKSWQNNEALDGNRSRGRGSTTTREGEDRSRSPRRWNSDELEVAEAFACEAFVNEIFGLHGSYLVGQARSSEVTLSHLDKVTRELYDISMGKEWANWLKYNAVSEITDDLCATLCKKHGVRVIPMRWVHTDRNAKARVAHTKTANLSIEAKSRCVVIGCHEDTQYIRGDSPTASLLGFNWVCIVTVCEKFDIFAADAESAFLQGDEVGRLLLLCAPNPPPPGVKKGQKYRAKSSIYGTKDAGRGWWKKVRRVLISCGWTESRLEHCLFFLVDDKGVLVGLLIIHVDDLFGGGMKTSAFFRDALDKLADIIKLKFKWENLLSSVSTLSRTGLVVIYE